MSLTFLMESYDKAKETENHIRGQNNITHTGHQSKCKRFSDSSLEECSVFFIWHLDKLYSLLHPCYKSNLFLCLCKNFHINKKTRKSNPQAAKCPDCWEAKVTLTERFHLEPRGYIVLPRLLLQPTRPSESQSVLSCYSSLGSCLSSCPQGECVQGQSHGLICASW